MTHRIFLVLLLAVLLSPHAFGATFSAYTEVCGGGPLDIRMDAQAESYSPNSFCGPGGGTAAALAGEGGLGASASYVHYCCQSYGQAGARASVDTEFIITGPAGPVLVSLNVALHGGTGGGTSDDYNARTIDMYVNAAGYVFTGYVTEVASNAGQDVYLGGTLAPPGTNCYLTCNMTTNQFYVNANTPLTFFMRLQAYVTSGTGNSYGQVSALDTFYFPLNGPVFNLPDGYSATIYGLNVEGNRVVGQDTGGGEVPEPATWTSLAAGLALLGLLRNRGIMS